MNINEVLEALAEQIADRVVSKLNPREARTGYLNVEQAAEYLACKPRRLYELRERRAIPGHKDGSRLIFTQAELDAYVEAQDEDQIGGSR